MSNSLDPDQARRFVGPDLGPNCLPRLSADDIGRQLITASAYLFLDTYGPSVTPYVFFLAGEGVGGGLMAFYELYQ